MRAVYFEGAGKPLEVHDIPEPTPGPGEMVIKVGRCGICGSDVHLTQEHGYYPEKSYLGHEFAGEVVAIGKGVERFKVGDNVTAMPAAGCGVCPSCVEGNPLLCVKGPNGYTGGFGDYMRVAEATSVRLPSSVSLADGALVEPLSVGLHGVALAQMKPGTRVLVLGAGSIGFAVTFWARQLGAGKIVVASRSAKHADMAMRMGADAYVQTGDNEVQEVQEKLGGPPEVVFECIGVPGALGQSINHVAINGTLVSLGFCTKPDGILPAITTFKQVRAIFSMAYTMREFEHCVDVLSRGHVEPHAMISTTIPIEAVPETIARLQKGGGSEGKIQVDPSL